MKRFLFLLFLFIFRTTCLYADLPNLAIVLTGSQIRAAQFHRLETYRVFRTDPDGTAVAIPFQIDQKDKYQDYILDQGAHQNSRSSNGIFNQNDELCFMGNDVGIRKVPTNWKGMNKPDILYEVAFNKDSIVNGKPIQKEGAVYIGIYPKNPPPLSTVSYVSFDLKNEQVLTSRFRYLFNKKNYIVVREVDVEVPGEKDVAIINLSSVFMRLDMKYFLTLNLGDSQIESELDAYKIGPVRVISRVNFDYKLIGKLKFSLDMYTEVSFFTNEVNLPAVIDNPIDGKKTLNKGSYFDYGLGMVENPKTLNPKSNMSDYKSKGNYIQFEKKQKGHGSYWASAASSKYMLYLEFKPSAQMEMDGNIPYLYIENVAKEELSKRQNKALPLGESPVNVAVLFNLDNFHKGLHQVEFRVFIENVKNEALLEDFKSKDQWKFSAQRVNL